MGALRPLRILGLLYDRHRRDFGVQLQRAQQIVVIDMNLNDLDGSFLIIGDLFRMRRCLCVVVLRL